MLPSLSNLFQRRPLKRPGKLHIELQNNAVTATLFAPRSERIMWDKTWAIQSHLDTTCFQHIAKDLDQLIGRSAPDINVILPDPMVRHIRFEVDTLPEKATDIEALIQWRVREDFFVDSEQSSLDYTIDNLDDKKNISVYIADQEWLHQFEESFLQYNLLISAYYTSSLYGLSQSNNPAWNGFMLNIADDFISYGYIKDGKHVQVLESQYVDADDITARYQFLQRGRREFAAIQLHTPASSEQGMIKLGSDVMDAALLELFPDYPLQAAR